MPIEAKERMLVTMLFSSRFCFDLPKIFILGPYSHGCTLDHPNRIDEAYNQGLPT
jgi:hypothetical protein